MVGYLFQIITKLYMVDFKRISCMDLSTQERNSSFSPSPECAVRVCKTKPYYVVDDFIVQLPKYSQDLSLRISMIKKSLALCLACRIINLSDTVMQNTSAPRRAVPGNATDNLPSLLRHVSSKKAIRI